MDQSLAKYQEKISSDPKQHVFIPSTSGMDEWEATLRPAIEAWTKDHPKGSALIKAYKEEIAKVRTDN
jgi:hypothetical protein